MQNTEQVGFYLWGPTKLYRVWVLSVHPPPVKLEFLGPYDSRDEAEALCTFLNKVDGHE